MPDNNVSEVASGAQILQVGGSWLPKITSYNYTLEDIDSDDTNRAENGAMHRKIIRSAVYHASVQHKCPTEEMIAICSAVKEDATIEITAFCPGKDSDIYATFNAYVSKVSSSLIWQLDLDDEYTAWWEVNYQLIEV